MANAICNSVSKRTPTINKKAIISYTHNDSNQERPNSGHDTVQVAPPVCLLECLGVERCYTLRKLSLFQVDLALTWRD